MRDFTLQRLIEVGTEWLITRKWRITKKEGFPQGRNLDFGFLSWRALRFGVSFLLLPPPYIGSRQLNFHAKRLWASLWIFCVLSLSYALSLGCALNEVSTSSIFFFKAFFFQFLYQFSFKTLELFFSSLMLIKNNKNINLFIIS